MNFQEFKEKYEKVPVEHYPYKVDDNPVVSVCVQTYNHEPYIKECLDGILKQETDFPFEILLGEDEGGAPTSLPSKVCSCEQPATDNASSTITSEILLLVF